MLGAFFNILYLTLEFNKNCPKLFSCVFIPGRWGCGKLEQYKPLAKEKLTNSNLSTGAVTLYIYFVMGLLKKQVVKITVNCIFVFAGIYYWHTVSQTIGTYIKFNPGSNQHFLQGYGYAIGTENNPINKSFLEGIENELFNLRRKVYYVTQSFKKHTLLFFV